jgi:hypothetical protein
MILNAYPLMKILLPFSTSQLNVFLPHPRISNLILFFLTKMILNTYLQTKTKPHRTFFLTFIHLPFCTRPLFPTKKAGRPAFSLFLSYQRIPTKNPKLKPTAAWYIFMFLPL